MKKAKLPQFPGNLYRDMRDRHLLLPALALLMGMLAVPVLLKSHSDAHRAATAASGSTKATSAVPAVVKQDMEVTNYKKRLDQLQSKNPFHQQYTSPPASAQAEAAPSASATTPSTPTSSPSTSSVSPPTTGSPSTSTSPSTSSPSPPSPSTSTSTQPTKPTFHLYTFRVSVKVGEANDLKDHPEVSSLALLPSKHKPILSFLEANGKQALFLVSRDVESVNGDGRCVPRRRDCQYIIMRPGQKADFKYTPDGKRYNLVLVDIHAVEIGHKPPTEAATKSAVTKPADLEQKLPLLGDG